jgi:RNA polymerase sigma-70 factor (ECF subfamily)
MSANDDDRAQLARLGRGDDGALEPLYERYTDLLFSVAARIVGSATEAEEVVQETWVQAWRRASTYDPARGSVGAWLVTIARTRAIDRLRSAGSRARAETAAGSQIRTPGRSSNTDASDDVARSQASRAVNGALARLEPHHREVVVLAYFGGFSQSEIAERLASPLGTVKSWTRQALQKLRELLPPEDWS